MYQEKITFFSDLFGQSNVNDKKSEILQTEGHHFRSTICKINDVNCSYFDKSILNVYSPMSPKMFLGPAVGQRWPNSGHPNSVHPYGAHPNGAHPNGAHPNRAYPNGAHPNGAHPSSAEQCQAVPSSAK